MDTPQNASQALLEHLGWQMLRRDDHRVAESIVTKREVDGVHNLDEGGLLDGFMAFLDETGFLEYLSSMDIADCQRRIIPIVHLMLTYMAKTLFNISSVYSLPEILFSDPDVMNTLGFNAYLLEHGLSKRSQEKRSPDKDRPKPFCPQMLADFIGKINIHEAERLFNEAIASLVRFHAFPKTLNVVLDSTDIEVPEDCPGAGCATRVRKTPANRKGVREVESTVFGFKAIVLFDLTTQIPIAVKVGKIQRNDARFTRSLIRQAQKNLAGSNCRIKKVMMDRGFLSGRTMWWLDSQGIYFVCPARKDMMVAKHARSLARDGQGYVQQRQRQVQHGHGKDQTTEMLSTEVVGITGLNTWETYNDPSQLQFQDNRGYRPASINAVVVRQWDNKDVGPNSWVVYLTNQTVTKPLTIFDDYDNRSIIENSLFREAKQAWSLEAIPKRTQRAAVAHIFITFTVMALASAYRTWKERDEAEESYSNLSLKPVGVRRWRRQLKAKTQDHVIAFADGYYGIFHVAEFTVLTGFRVRVLPREVGSVKDIYLRYGLSPPQE